MALAIGDDAIAARGYQHMMLTLTFLGRHEEAAKVSDEARARLRACGDRGGRADAAGAARAPAPARRAARGVRRGVRRGPGPARRGQRRAVGHRPTCTWCPASRCSRCPGGKPTATRVLRKALHGKQELGDVIGIAYALDVLGWLSAKTGLARAGRRGCSARPTRCGSAAAACGSAGPRSWRSSTSRRRAAARAALGAAEYDARYAAGTSYVRRRLDAHAGGGPLRLEIPESR